MKILTIPGRTYVVTSESACRVSTRDGVALVRCEPGSQSSFVAPAPEVVVSCEDAIVTEKTGAGVGCPTIGEGIEVSYSIATQSPPEGNRDNYDAAGWALVMKESGRLESITLEQRSTGSIRSPFAVWLKVWVDEGGSWRLLGTSLEGVEQKVKAFSTWTFSGIDVEAGMKLHVDAHRSPESETLDASLSVRVVANTLPDTGMLDEGGMIHSSAWAPVYTLTLACLDGLSACGLRLVTQEDLEDHVDDAQHHVSAAERIAWNGKADASALATKVNSATFSAHTGNATVHVTAEERARWNAESSLQASSLFDGAGNAVFEATGEEGKEGLNLSLRGINGNPPLIKLDSDHLGNAELGVDHLRIQRQTGVLSLETEGTATSGVTCSAKWECAGEVTRCDVKELLKVPSYFASPSEATPLKGCVFAGPEGAFLAGGGCRVELAGDKVLLCARGASVELGEEQLRRLASLLAE